MAVTGGTSGMAGRRTRARLMGMAVIPVHVAAMMRIRSAQMRAIADALGLEQFEADMLPHLRLFSPHHAQVAGDDGRRESSGWASRGRADTG